MTLERFEDLLDLYGPDLTCWPTVDRDAASALLSSSETARDLMTDAAFMTDALDHYTIADPSPEFEASLLDLAPIAAAKTAPKAGGFFSWFDVRIFSTAGAALACAAFGLVIGLNAAAPADTTTDEAEMFVTAALTTYDATFWEGDEG